MTRAKGSIGAAGAWLGLVMLLCIAPVLGGVELDTISAPERRLDDGEPGIPGVQVSNGRDVVETDTKGGYELKVAAETVIFVVKPLGWMTPVSEWMLPAYRNFKPGSMSGAYFLCQPDHLLGTIE